MTMIKLKIRRHKYEQNKTYKQDRHKTISVYSILLVITVSLNNLVDFIKKLFRVIKNRKTWI